MKTKWFLKFSALTLLFLPRYLFAQDYTADSLAVRTILDVNGLQTLSVASVSDSSKGRIWRLTLVGKKLTTLPPAIGSLTGLQYLDLRTNNLTTLPAEIGNLVLLSHCELRSNSLSALPPEIGKLIKLNRLFLSFNNLTAIPPEIGDLTNMSTLYLFFNDLATLPPGIGNCTNLYVLSLEGNKLTTIPPEIGNLNNLSSLTLDENSLSSIPPQIGNCVNLIELNLAWNNLTTLPEALIQLSPSSNLDLGFNWLDNTSLSDTLISWADTWDPDWNETQPIIYNPLSNTAAHFKAGIQTIQNNAITYYLPAPENIRLDVLDLRGRLLSRLVDTHRQAGSHTVYWDSRRYGSGRYYFMLSTDNAATIEKAVFAK